jgi:general secretion pathway protein J
MKSAHALEGSRVPRDDGFTLLEVLIALALFALITVLVLAGIRGGRTALEKANLSNRNATIDSAQGLLRNLITEVRPIPLSGADTDAPILFSGAPDRIEFVSSYTVEGQFAGLYVSSLRVIQHQGQGTGDLVLSQTLYRPSTRVGAGASVPSWNTVLIKNVTGMRLRYYGTPDLGAASNWSANWSRLSALPELVEIVVAFPPGDERAWRSMSVTLAFAE